MNNEKIEKIEIGDVPGERPLSDSEFTGIEVEEFTSESVEDFVSMFTKLHEYYGVLTPAQHATVNQEIARLTEYASSFEKGGVKAPEFITEGIDKLNRTLEQLQKAA